MKKTKHSQTSEPTAMEETEQQSNEQTEPSSQTSKKPGKPTALTPYLCKYCKFRCVSENGINLHWKRCHSSSHPLDFECESHLLKADSVKIYYQCLHCQDRGTFDEVKEHSRLVHPEMSMKVSRLTGKGRMSETFLQEPPTKKMCEEKEDFPIASTSQTVFNCSHIPFNFSL